jgi:hypothetical protein
MVFGKRIGRALAVAALLMTSLSGSAFAAKAQDPEPTYICFAFMGHVICVPVS